MLPILILSIIFSLVVGLTLIFNPALAIEIQRRFYEKINWKIEPISMQKEIRNTRLMGAAIAILLSAALFFIFFNKLASS